MSDILSYILHVFQVAKLVRLLKHKLRQDNAYFKAQDFDAVLSAHYRNKNPQVHFRNKNPRYTLFQYNIIYDIVSDIIPDIWYHSDRIYVHCFLLTYTAPVAEWHL